MRIDVKKYLLIGPRSIKDTFLQRLQEKGIVEIIGGRKSLEMPQEIQDFIDALHVLRQRVSVKQASLRDYSSAHVLATHINESNQELEKLKEHIRILRKEIARIEPFGDISLYQLREVEQEAHRVFQFFFAKANSAPDVLKNRELIHVASAYGLDYYISINKEPTSYPGLIEMKIDRSLGELQSDVAQNLRKIDFFETELAALAHSKSYLKKGLFNALNHYHLEESKQSVQSLLEGDAFAAEVWVPKNKITQLVLLAEQFHVHAERIQIEEKDKVPTYLQNSKLAASGQDLVSIYDTPSSTDRDPSLWVFIAFGIFFSMIIADAGYGLLLLGLSIWLFFKFREKKGLFRRFILLTTSLSIGCIIWGTLLSSFFGIDLAPDNSIRKFSLINWAVEKKADYFVRVKPPSYVELLKEYPQIKNPTTGKELLMTPIPQHKGGDAFTIYTHFTDNVLIELAIFVGALHIIISFARYLDRNWAGLGWIFFIIGSYLFFPSILKAVSLIHYIFGVPFELGAQIGKYMMYSGLGLAAILAIIQKRLSGLAEIMNVIQVFADIMSYLRIYALSLAGMIMASTFNRIGMGMPIYLGIFIILAGHLVNITLALMGGTIHGLRLNFIEWYHYSFEGGGKKFNPLSLYEID